MYSTSPEDHPFRGKTLHSVQSGNEIDAQSDDVDKVTTQASPLPPALLERGIVNSREEMMTGYTNEDWEGIIAEVNQTVENSKAEWEGKVYPRDEDQPFAKTIDHTLLKLDATGDEIEKLCAEARVNGFATVCVRPPWVQHCASHLRGSDVQIASVIGFHEGTYDLSHKLQETTLSLTSSAHDLDVVLHAPDLLAGRLATIYHELATLRAHAPRPVVLKLILETSRLAPADVVAACVLADAAAWDFVKTSTGFVGRGATVEDVRLMRAVCEVLAVKEEERERGSGDGNAGSAGAGGGGAGAGARKMRVKASGGIRTYGDAVRMLEAGASRLGTSSGVLLAREARGVVDDASGKGDMERKSDLQAELGTELEY